MTPWLNDTYVLFVIESKRFTRQAAIFVINSLIAAAVFFLFRLAADPPPQVELRLLAGAIVFGVAMQSINATGQIMVSERFEGQMKLFRTSSISQASYRCRGDHIFRRHGGDDGARGSWPGGRCWSSCQSIPTADPAHRPYCLGSTWVRRSHRHPRQDRSGRLHALQRRRHHVGHDLTHLLSHRQAT